MEEDPCKSVQKKGEIQHSLDQSGSSFDSLGKTFAEVRELLHDDLPTFH
jgi:hypothetical protein